MSLKLGNSLCKHQSVIKVTRWNLKVISLHIPLHFKQSVEVEEEASYNESNYVPDLHDKDSDSDHADDDVYSNDWVERLNSDEKVSYLNN